MPGRAQHSPDIATGGKEAPERILEAAKRLFHQQGYDGTSITQIARTAEMATGNLYWHFKSKQDILEAVLLPMYETSYRALEAAVTPEADPPTRLSQTVRELVRDQITSITEDANFGYISLAASLGEQAQQRLKEHRLAFLNFIEVILADGVTRKCFAIRDLTVTAQALTTMCEYVFLWYRPGGRMTMEQVADVYVELALNMVGAEPASL